MREKMLGELRKYKNVKIIKKDLKNKKELDSYDKIVIATGSSCGYDLAQQFSHTIVEPKKALCGYVTREKYPPGVSLETDDGALLFTHQGVSGPFIYKHSSINAYAPFPREIDVNLIDNLKLKEAI